MKSLLVGLGAVAIVFIVLVMVTGVVWISSVNAEVSARNALIAQQKANESSFDKLWKTISQQAQVPLAERESFQKTYAEIMKATKGIAGNGQLASFFQQAKVDISPDMFKKLMSTIEAQRESFHRDQQHLLVLKQQHDNIRMRFPSSLFVGNRPEFDVHIVTSSRTSAVFESASDNDISLFKTE